MRTDPSESPTCVLLSNDSFDSANVIMSVYHVTGIVIALKIQICLSLDCTFKNNSETSGKWRCKYMVCFDHGC